MSKAADINQLVKKVNCTEPSLSVRVPCTKHNITKLDVEGCYAVRNVLLNFTQQAQLYYAGCHHAMCHPVNFNSTQTLSTIAFSYGTGYLTGDNLKVVWAESSSLS